MVRSGSLLAAATKPTHRAGADEDRQQSDQHATQYPENSRRVRSLVHDILPCEWVHATIAVAYVTRTPATVQTGELPALPSGKDGVDIAESRTLYSRARCRPTSLSRPTVRWGCTQLRRTGVHSKPPLRAKAGSSLLTARPAAAGASSRRTILRHEGRRSSIMNVGRRVDYAIRALCYLAAQPAERVVPRSEIQERQNIPPHFLSKILRSLVGAGFLASVPGARGGFRLGAPAREISVRAVYESVEGQLSLIECVDRREAFCCFAPVCTQIHVWSGAQQLLGEYLENISIGDIADRNGLVPRLSETSPHGLRRA